MDGEQDLKILNLKEDVRMLEMGAKQLIDEIKLLIKDRDILIGALEYIKKQYEDDFTEEELSELEPRDDSVYNEVIESLELIKELGK